MKSVIPFLLTAALSAAVAQAQDSERSNGGRNYEVTITNITPGVVFTPTLIAVHNESVSLFRLGERASAELAVLAEGGDTAPLAAALMGSGNASDTTSSTGLLEPGKSVTLSIRASGRFDRLSVAAMLLPTNDAFYAVNSVELPKDRRPITIMAVGYDAGSEPNDERCSNIPGPQCGGEGASPNRDGEGFVHVSNGIHGFAELPAPNYDWRNPVARITIRRVGN